MPKNILSQLEQSNKYLKRIVELLEEKGEIKSLPPILLKEEKPTFQQLLDSTGRLQYTDKNVVNSVIPHELQKIEFFKLDTYLSAEELEKEYERRNLTPADPYALALYANDNQNEFDEKKYIATQWKDKNGEFCYLTFDGWYGRRSVHCHRSADGWSDSWFLVGVRK